MKLSGGDVYLFWPFSERGYGFQPIFALGHPLNTWLAYTFMILPWLLAFWTGVTPLEILSRRLDLIFLNAFRKKPLSCATCGTACNNECDAAETPARPMAASTGDSHRLPGVRVGNRDGNCAPPAGRLPAAPRCGRRRAALLQCRLG
jgi:hypothetical protein